jgi:predicted permease
MRDGTHHRTPLRTGLPLLTQSALWPLLVGAGLFVQSVRNVRDVRLGFDADSVLVVSPNMRDVRPTAAAMAALRFRLLDAVTRVPGVTHATLQEAVPFGGTSSYSIFVAGIDSVSKLGEFDVNTVSADYFATMGTRILRGRAIEASDTEGAQPVVVIGASMGAVLWPGQDPIGRCFRVYADSMPCRRVVGVAEDIHSQSIETESRLFYYYLPAAQWRADEGGLFVRVQGDASRLIEPVRKHLQREMPATSYVTVSRLAEFTDGKMRSWIVGAKVFTALGLLALVLAAVGLYSVIAYNVTQRRHELGVRLALGAERARIVRMVVTESLRTALTGVLIGSLFALAGGRWVAPLLFHQSPRDPMVFAAVTIALLGVAIAASWIPALRAGSMDPKAALQSD